MVVENQKGEEDEQENEGRRELELESIHCYINKTVSDEDDESTYFALNFLREYVGGLQAAESEHEDESEDADEDENERVVGSVHEAQGIVNDLANGVRKKVLSLLTAHVKPSHRKSAAATKKDLVGWLQQSNKVRNFWFYKINGLKEVAESMGLNLGKGRKTADQIRAILASPREHRQQQQEQQEQEAATYSTNADLLLPKEAAIRAILEKSFLPHQKGRAREYCSLGHRLELPILRNWIEVISSHNSPVPSIKIKGAYSAGLAAKQGAEFIKDSIDFVVIAENDDDGTMQPWGFESKGRVTARTTAEEVCNLHFFNNPHIAISSQEVHKEVADEGERFQVLQHALVYNFDKVVLAIGDEQATLIRSTIISFENDIKSDFLQVLNDIFQFSLSWAYPATGPANKCITVPSSIQKIATTIPTINGSETLQEGTVNIWHSLCKLQKPFPSFIRLIPAIYAFWNSVKKGGSDTTTKLMDECILRVPKCHLNTETAACA